MKEENNKIQSNIVILLFSEDKYDAEKGDALINCLQELLNEIDERNGDFNIPDDVKST